MVCLIIVVVYSGWFMRVAVELLGKTPAEWEARVVEPLDLMYCGLVSDVFNLHLHVLDTPSQDVETARLAHSRLELLLRFALLAAMSLDLYAYRPSADNRKDVGASEGTEPIEVLVGVHKPARVVAPMKDSFRGKPGENGSLRLLFGGFRF